MMPVLAVACLALLNPTAKVKSLFYFPMYGQSYGDITAESIEEDGYDLTSVVKKISPKIVSIATSASLPARPFQDGAIRLKIVLDDKPTILIDLLHNVKIGKSVKKLDDSEYRRIFTLIHDELPGDD